MKKPAAKYYNAGFTIVEMMIVSAIIAILCAIAVPNFIKIRSNAYKDVCITNLMRIAAAKEHWSMETGAVDTAVPTDLQLNPYIKDETSSLKCPMDTQNTFSTSYSINAINEYPACKISPGTHKLQ